MEVILLGNNNGIIESGITPSIIIPNSLPSTENVLIDIPNPIEVNDSIITPSLGASQSILITDESVLENPTRKISMPIGGALGQVLGKLSGVDYNVGWIDVTGGGVTLNGTGLVRMNGTSVSYDNSTYVTGTPWASMGYVTGTPWTSQGYVTGTPWTGMGYLTSLGTALVDADFPNNGIMTRTGAGTYGYITDNSTTWNALVSFPGFGTNHTTAAYGDHTHSYEPVVTKAALTKVDDTNVTLSLGGTPTTALFQAVSLTLGWTGTLADARITSSGTWNAKQTGHSNLTSVASLTYASSSFVKMTGANTFTLDTNTYQVTNANLTSLIALSYASGSFVKMTGINTFTLDTNSYSLSNHVHAESTVTFTDITTNNATTGLHGYLPKLGGGTTNFLRADGTWAAPSGGSMVYPSGSGIAVVLSGSSWDTTISTTKIPIFASAITGTPNASTFLRGDGTWAAGGGGEPALGNPASNGQVLSSTTAGVRSWINNGSGGGVSQAMALAYAIAL